MMQTSAEARLADVVRRRRLAHSPLVEQLAVLAEFDPATLQNDDTVDVVRYFCSTVWQTTGPPHFFLSEKARLDALVSLLRRDGSGGLVALRKRTTPHVQTPLQRMLDVFTLQDGRTAEELDEYELLAALQVWRWATEATARARVTMDVRIPFDRDSVEGRLASLNVTRAVRSLASRGCIGREDELTRLHDYVDESAGDGGWIFDPPMVVYGVGGVGKSTLIARFVMDLVEGRVEGSPPGRRAWCAPAVSVHGESAYDSPPQFAGVWAYLDMDRPTLRRYRPEEILDEIVRQVAAQLPEARRLLEGVRREAVRRSRGAGLESVDTPLRYGAVDELVQAIAARGHSRLVVILDTFEEVTLAGPEGPVQIFDFFELLRGRLRELKLIVSGRAPAAPFAQRDDRILQVTNFSGDSAVRLLRHFFSDLADDDAAWLDTDFARDVVATVGGNPLALQLAARVLAKEGRRGFDEEARQATVDRVRQEFIQGFLYRRILEHVDLPDPAATEELRIVAKAALALRKVTPQLLAEVLLPSLGGQFGRDADWFYTQLGHEVAFMNRHSDHLRLREELRGPALVAVGYDDRALVDRIHRAAAGYYATRRAINPDAVEEFAYHQLALGIPLSDLDLDSATIDLLAGSPLFSFPPGVADDVRRARSQSREEVSAGREQLAWERRVRSEADAALQSGRLGDARALLAERRTRRPDTQLYRIESRLHEAAGDVDRAIQLSRRDLEASKIAGDRIRFAAAAIRTAELEERLGRESAADILRVAADDALLAGDHAVRLELHLSRMATLERMERLDDDHRWFLDLDARSLLARVPPPVIATSTAIIKGLAATLGRDQPTLVLAAAERVGLGPDEDPIRLRRLAAAVTSWDRHQDDPGRLARAVGISGAGPVDEMTWLSALAGLGTEAGTRIGTLWEIEEPPPDVREAVRAFYLWWGVVTARGAEESMPPADFLDTPIDFSLPAAQQLHRFVVDGYGSLESLIGLADRAGIDPGSVDLHGSPDAIVRNFLLQASAQHDLRRVVDAIIDDPSVGTLGNMVRDLVYGAGGG